MKKTSSGLLLICLMIFSTHQVIAQTFSIRGGLNLSNMLHKNDNVTLSDDFDSADGFHFGLGINVPLNEFLSFDSGLLLSSKGMNFNVEEGDLKNLLKRRLLYLDIPLTLKASYDFENSFEVFGLAGPYLGFGLHGTDQLTIKSQGETITKEKEDIQWGSDDDEDILRFMDTGFTFGAGMEIENIIVGIYYDLGVANISTYQDQGTNVKNRVLRFSIGYNF